MNTYHIPREGRTHPQYAEYCLTLPWVFVSDRSISPDPYNEQVTLDGSIEGFTLLPPVVSPVQITPLSILAFMDRFTDAELTTILTVAKTVPALEVFVKKLEAATAIVLSDARTIAGVTALEAGGLIAAGRAAEILGGN